MLNRSSSIILIISLLVQCQQFQPEEQIGINSLAETPQDSLRRVVADIMALPHKTASKVEYEIESSQETENYSQQKILIKGVSGEEIPAYLLKPKNLEPPYPVMICLQGHAPGMYISIGEARTEQDKKLIAGGRDLALQAIENGWAALTIEQRGFGEQAAEGVDCNDLSLRDLMRGKPMLGQRVADVMRGIDFIETQSDLNTNLIGSMGNSAGGTVSYFAACMDPRIQLAVVSCSFSTYERSWLKYHHCACGYLPGLLKVADMPDLAELIAPRHLLIVAGKEDYIADIEGVREGFAIAQTLYNKENAADRVMLIEGDDGHRFYPELAWPKINEIRDNLHESSTLKAGL